MKGTRKVTWKSPLTLKKFKVRTWTKIFGVPQNEKKWFNPDDQFFLASLKNFSTSQKGRMKTSDFRPTLKAHEMAHASMNLI